MSHAVRVRNLVLSLARRVIASSIACRTGNDDVIGDCIDETPLKVSTWTFAKDPKRLRYRHPLARDSNLKSTSRASSAKDSIALGSGHQHFDAVQERMLGRGATLPMMSSSKTDLYRRSRYTDG